MTRAIDRLIVAGSVDPEQARRRRRRSAGCSTGSSSPSSRTARSSRGEARLRLRVDRYAPEPRRPSRWRRPPSAQLSLFDGGRSAPALEVPALPPLEPVAAPPVEPSAASPTRRCPVRELLVPLLRRAHRRACARWTSSGARARPDGHGGDRDRRRRPPAARARRPGTPRSRRRSTACSCWYPAATAEELGAHRRARRGVLRVDRSRRGSRRSRASRSERPFAFEHDGVLFHGCSTCSTCDGGTGARRRLQVEPARRPLAGGRRRGRLPAAAARVRDRLLPCGRRRGRGRLPVPGAARRAGRGRRSARASCRQLEAELSAAIARIQEGRFPPRPSEYACAGCPALDVVCAGPALRG